MLESAFFQDLAMLMTAAGVVAAIFARLGWPKVIGYILAGIFMSEYTWGGSFLADAGSVKIIGQLGVVFLMFGMGLSFSARDMKKMKSIAFPTAAFDVVGMILVGYTVGTKVFGWSPVESVFLGVAILLLTQITALPAALAYALARLLSTALFLLLIALCHTSHPSHAQ